MERIRTYAEGLMRDRKNDFLSGMVKTFLWAISCVYGALVRCHHFFYGIGLLRSFKASCTVVSVGNITLGGTGKTPLAILIAGRLAKNAKKGEIAVLIRGYGEDEWKMLKDELEPEGVSIFVGRDRVKSSGKAVSQGAGTVILDDGFQHLRLKRDLDIVLVDSSNPFGNGHIFPRGILRESPSNLKRADIIVLTKCGSAKSDIDAALGKIKSIAPGAAILRARHMPVGLYALWKGGKEEAGSLRGKKVCIFSGISDPSYFRGTVESTGARVESEFAFPDHYDYKKSDLGRIFSESARLGVDRIVTTEKDAVKVKAFHDQAWPEVWVLAVEFEIMEGDKALDACLHRLHMRDPR